MSFQSKAILPVRYPTILRQSCPPTNPTLNKTSMKKQDTAYLFRKQNYKVCLSVRIHHSSLPVVSTFDTGAGSNLGDRSFHHFLWRQYIRPAADLCLKYASNQPIRIEGTIRLIVLLGDLRVRVSFGVVDISRRKDRFRNVVHQPIHPRNSSARTTNCINPISTSRHTCVVLVRQSD